MPATRVGVLTGSRRTVVVIGVDVSVISPNFPQSVTVAQRERQTI